MQTCPKCKKTKDDSFFFRGGKRKQFYCKKCNLQNTLDRQRKFKEKCVEYKGGKCEICSYSKCAGALEFHHRDPNEKDFTFSHIKQTSWDKNKIIIIEELDKCDLLCANCHRERHAGLV